MNTIPASRHLFAVALLLAFTGAIFGQSVFHEYIALDDPVYVSRNPHMLDHLSWQVLRWAVTDIVVSNWHPVTMLSHALVAAAFGLDAGPQHAANVVLHGLNACLLYLVLWRFTGAWWPSLLAALLFTVHPLRVESVAWISDRKGLLSPFFALLALLAYERYVRNKRALAYIGVLAAFALALLSKPDVVALPFAMLLLDYWLRRFEEGPGPLLRRGADLVMEKLPLLVLSVGSSVITYAIQQETGAVQDAGRYSAGVRIANAVVSYVMYVVNTFVPYPLALQYPHPGEAVYGSLLYISIPVFIALTIAAALCWKRRPWFAVGWFWFCGMLVPAIGVVQVAHQARADRYTYLPQIGLLIAIAWGLDELRRRIPAAARPLTVTVALWVLALAGAAFIQTSLWKNDYTLFKYTVERAPGSAQARYFLGSEYVKRGDLKSAEEQFRAAIECKLLMPEAFNNLGVIELRRGDYTQAAEHFGRAVQLEDSKPEWLVNLGVALFNLGRRAEAEALVARALQFEPGHPRALELQAACRAAVAKP